MPAMTPRAGPRVRIGRSALGVLGQVLNSGTNFVTGYIASYLLAPDAFGRFVLAYAMITIALASVRGLVGSTLLAHLPRCDPDDRPALAGSALGFTAAVGLIGVGVLAMVATITPAVAWFIPWVLFAMVQDVCRYILIADGRPERSLLLDMAWAAAQFGVLAAWVLTGQAVALGVLACAWGVGAVVGAVAFLALSPVRPRHPARWIRTTRDVSGWFTATAVVGQLEVYLVLLLATALLSPADAGGLRAVQLVILQPAVVLLGAVSILGTPAFSRLPSECPSAALVRPLWTVTAAILPVIGVVLLALPVREPLLELLLPHYTGFGYLVLPTTLHAVLVALAVPALALLRGRRRGHMLLGLQVLRMGFMAIATPIGIVAAGIHGAAWAQTAAGALGLIAIGLATARACRRSSGAAAPSRPDPG